MNAINSMNIPAENTLMQQSYWPHSLTSFQWRQTEEFF